MIAARYKGITSIFILLSAMYVALSLLLPTDKMALAKYKISTGQLRAIVLAIIIPYLIIWFIALIGYLRLKSYTTIIEASKDGGAFQLVASGIFLLALWLPVSAIVDSISRWYTRVQPSSASLMVSLSNYSTVIILLTAFAILYRGSKRLLAVIKKPQVVLPLPVMVVYISVCALYVLLVIHDPARQFPTPSVPAATYYLPDWLIITTIVIPRLIMWYLGIRAVHNIYLYRKMVKGPIYKQPLDNLAKGIGWVVVAIIALRAYQSLSSQISHLSLSLLLLVIYLLLSLVSVGYVLIAKGAKNLQRIEEV